MGLRSFIKEIAHQVLARPRIGSRQWDYDEYWRSKRATSMGVANYYQAARAAWIAKRVEEGDTVLDIGCGDGAVLFALRSLVKVEAMGADISDVALEHVRSCGVTALRYDVSDIARIEELPMADHVLLLEVLEHMANPEEFLMRIRNRARKSVFFSFPNTGYMSYRLRFMLGRFPVQWIVSPGEHLRFWTHSDLLWWLTELNLSSVSTVGVYAGVGWLRKVWPNLFGAALICQVLSDGCKPEGDA